MSCLPYMYDNDVAGNNKLQANLWRQSMELGRGKITFGGSEKKKSIHQQAEVFSHPNLIIQLTLEGLGFRVWLSNYPLRGLGMFRV